MADGDRQSNTSVARSMPMSACFRRGLRNSGPRSTGLMSIVP